MLVCCCSCSVQFENLNLNEISVNSTVVQHSSKREDNVQSQFYKLQHWRVSSFGHTFSVVWLPGGAHLLISHLLCAPWQCFKQRSSATPMAEAARLLEAAFSNDCKALRLYLKKGYDGAARSGETPRPTLLHQVAMLECSDGDKGSMVRTLIKKGVQVDARDDVGFTALMRCKTKAAAAALLDHGADVQACNELDECCTALMYAQQKDNLELVQLLLQRGAAVNAVTLGHESALFYSCFYGRVGALSALLAAGADANGGLLAGDVALSGTPLHAAVDINDERDLATQKQLVKLLLQHGDARNCCGQTPLMLAALDGSAEIASMLLAAGASVSAICTQWHKTALHYAVKLCRMEVLQALLDNGADAAATDVDGELPLHGACQRGSVKASTAVMHYAQRQDTVVTVAITVAVQ
jgi:ankyrin repeat protein